MGNPNNQNIDLAAIRKDVEENADHHISVLREGLKASFTDLNGFQKWILEEMKKIGMQADEFEVAEKELLDQPSDRKMLRETPELLKRGINVVGKVPGKGSGGGGVLLFGHADKPPETYEWGKEKQYSDLVESEGRLHGPGIADDVAGITALLGAVETFNRLGMEPQGDLLVASILGKQLGVFGTYGLVTRYGPVDGAIYMHPAESGNGLGDLKVTSLGMAEFIIHVEGKIPETSEPHQTIYSQTGVSAIEKGIYLFQGLHKWAEEMNKKPELQHHELNKQVGQSFAISFGKFLCGEDNLVYHIPTECDLYGVINYPPETNLETMQAEFAKAYEELVKKDPWLSQNHVSMEWGDIITESSESDLNSEFIKTGFKAITDVTGKTPRLNYGHSCSDLRYPMLWWKAQGFGVGPTAGDMNTPTEWVDREEYMDTIITVTEILKHAG